MLKRIFVFVFIILNLSLLFASNTTDFNITNTLETNLIDYQVKLQLSSSNVSEDFDWGNLGSDLKVTTTDNQDLNFWIEDFNATAETATLWVKIPLLEESGTYSLKLKYNQGDINLSNGDNTFIFFDDFSEDKTVLYSKFGLANATDPLTIPTYDGSGRNVHPSLVYFEEPFNGWKYWMAFTPYLDSNAFFENPSIVVSNDGLTWQVPDGLTNPIDLPTEGGNNSDPSLFYDGEKFILYYREFFNTTERINYRYSLDGNTWSEEQTVLNDRKYKFIAPTVIKKEEIYYMWVVESDYVLGDNDSGGCAATDSNLVRYESDDGISWTNPVVNTTGIIDYNLVLWHPDIKYISELEEYWMIFSAHNSNDPNCSASETYFARSPDGLTWTTYLDKKTLGKLESGWQKGSIYKSTFLYDEASNKIRVWYSGNDAGYPITAWNTGYTEENYDVFLKRVDINSTKWQIHKEGSQEVSIIYDSGELKLKGKTDVISSANISTTHLLPNNNFIVEVKQKISERNYVGTSLGTLNNGLLCYSGSGSLNNSTLCNGYFFANWSTNWYLRYVDLVSINIGQAVIVEPSTVNTYHKLKYVYTNSGFLGWYIDDILKASRTHTTYLSYPKYLMFSQGEYNSTPKGGTRTIDYVFVRNYASTEPTVTYEVNNELTLTYIAGENGTIDGNINQIIIKGEDGTQVTAIPDEGYHFVNWSDGNTSAIRQDTNVQADISVTANFDINTYTVLFKDWNGEVLKPEDVNYDGNATAPADPTRTGYTFNGWDVAFNNIISDLNITAQYTINTYTVLFKDWNGEVLKTEDVNYGNGATAPADPTRARYTFNGWDVAFNNIISDLNITAQYTINTSSSGGSSSGRSSSSSSTSSTSSQPISEQPRTIEIINTNENPSNSVQEKQETLKENEIQLIDQEILSKNEVEILRKTEGELTKSKANLNVIIKVKNQTNKQKSVSVIEIIPKEIADHVDKINFKIKPTEIINPDPIVLWKLTLSPNQDVNLEYSVSNITDVNLLNDYNSIIQNWVTPIVTTKIELIPIIETKECIDTDKDPCTISVLIDNECVIKKICYEQTPKENKIVRAKFNYLPIVLLVLVLLIIWLLFNIIEPKNKYPKLNYNKPSLFIRKRKSKKK